MTIKQIFLKLNNPEHWYYSHKDQTENGLRFQVWYSNSNIALYGVKGENEKITNYIARFGTRIKELSDMEMKTEMDTYIPSGIKTCDVCEGTGSITIPVFDTTKSKAELNEMKHYEKR